MPPVPLRTSDAAAADCYRTHGFFGQVLFPALARISGPLSAIHTTA
jgi:hypothetical protein